MPSHTEHSDSASKAIAREYFSITDIQTGSHVWLGGGGGTSNQNTSLDVTWHQNFQCPPPPTRSVTAQRSKWSTTTPEAEDTPNLVGAWGTFPRAIEIGRESAKNNTRRLRRVQKHTSSKHIRTYVHVQTADHFFSMNMNARNLFEKQKDWWPTCKILHILGIVPPRDAVGVQRWWFGVGWSKADSEHLEMQRWTLSSRDPIETKIKLVADVDRQPLRTWAKSSSHLPGQMLVKFCL